MSADFEKHPSFGAIVVNRVSSTGTHLFDSELSHHDYVSLSIHEAERKRRHSSDWIHPTTEIIEVAMSMAQWAQVVSSFGIGGGTPVTIVHRDGQRVEEPKFEARMELSTKEIREAAQRQTEEVQKAFQKVVDLRASGGGKRAVDEAMRSLGLTIGNIPSNMQFVNDQMQRHVESVTTKAKADLEAIAIRAGIEAGTLDPVTMLGIGPRTES